MSRNRYPAVAALAALLALPTSTAVGAPKDDVHFTAEHLAEAAQDARQFALPWPSGEESGWQPVIAAGAARYGAGFAQVRGRLLALGMARALDGPWHCAWLVFHDRFEVSGGSGSGVLTSGSLGVPLDLPALAEISSASGRFVHEGIGLVLRREWGAGGEARWALVTGALIERLELQDYRFNYRLLSGANAGAGGVLDYSGASKHLTPFIGAQRDARLGAGWVMSLRAAVGVPLPAGDFNLRFTGPGFDRTTRAPGANPARIGDGYLLLGLGLRERASGMEIDLGALLGYGQFERLTHDGIRRALLLSLTWRGA